MWRDIQKTDKQKKNKQKNIPHNLAVIVSKINETMFVPNFW